MTRTTLVAVLLTLFATPGVDAAPRKMLPAEKTACKAQYATGSAADFRARANRLRQIASHFRSLHTTNNSRVKGTPAKAVDKEYWRRARESVASNKAEERRNYEVFQVFQVSKSEFTKTYYHTRPEGRLSSKLSVDASIAITPPMSVESYGKVAKVLETSASAWLAFRPALDGTVRNIQARCAEFAKRHEEWLAAKDAKAAKDTQAAKDATRSATAATTTHNDRLRESAKRQYEIDQRNAAAATAQRQRDQAKLQRMQADRDAAVNQGAANIANAAASLDPQGQTMLLGAGVAAALAGAMVGSYNENVEWQHASALGVVSMSAVLSAFGSLAIAGKSRSRDSTAKQILLGRSPWYGEPLTVQVGAGLAMPTVEQDQWYAVQPMEGGRYPGFIGQATLRLALARITLQASRHSGTFAPVAGGEDRDSIGWGLGAGIGIQPFSGGLFSPWAELRFGAYPNCEDEGTLVNSSVRTCAGPDTFRLGEGGGTFTSHLVVGNTFSFRNLLAHAVKPGMLRSLFIEVAYQFDAPTGSGPSVIAGFELCGGCE